MEWRLAGGRVTLQRGVRDDGSRSGDVYNGLPALAGPFLSIQSCYEKTGPLVQKIILLLWVRRAGSITEAYRGEYGIRGRMTPMQRAAMLLWIRRYRDWRKATMRDLGLLDEN